jgi:hypothetical protein
MRSIADDPMVAFVQRNGRKRVSPRPSQQEGATWGLDRSDPRDSPLDGSYPPRTRKGLACRDKLSDLGEASPDLLLYARRP